ncbi:hypothetical protein ABZ820_05125 [Streptomyces diacarni]|uniref:hypothetical protein n=1 Tax=Streptomyces diacarni TaxID=2800381 RepID=UPI0033F420F1
MFNRTRRRQAAEHSDMHRQQVELLARLESQMSPEVERMQAEAHGPAEPDALVDDFLPPELRVMSHDQLDGRMMPWPQPLVLNGEMATCTECGAYRDWLILSTRDQIWLRCRAGHQQHETRLDTAWYNRHAGPADATHATFEDCLRHLGH